MSLHVPVEMVVVFNVPLHISEDHLNVQMISGIWKIRYIIHIGIIHVLNKGEIKKR